MKYFYPQAIIFFSNYEIKASGSVWKILQKLSEYPT